MNLLFLASWYPETKDSRNGIFIWQHAAALAKNSKHQITLVAAVAQEGVGKLQIKHEVIEGVDHWVAYYPKSGNAVLRSWRYLWAYHQAIQAKESATGKSDLVVVNVLWRAGILAWLYQIFYSKPYIIIEHWSGYLPEGEGYKGFYLKYFTRLIADRAERILPVSPYLATSMQGRGLLNRYQVVPNIVRTDIFRPDATKQPKGNLILLHVSNLAPEKNFDFVVQIWQQLKQIHPQTELRVAGAYTEADKLQFEKYEGIQWLGFLEPPALADLYQSATALCMPSIFETFSIVIAEALACGCPVLATDLPTFDFYKKATNFYTLPLTDPALWQTKLLAIQSRDSVQSDFEFIDNNFSGLKVSERLVSLIEGVKL